jgi:histidinol-phosphate aminotransferase
MSYFRENIEKCRGYTPGFQPKKKNIIKLNTNENPYPPSPKVLKAIREISAENLRRYPDPVGNEFRTAAAEVNSVRRENIMCCNGGDDLLNIAFRAFCDGNRPVAYPVPTYSLYPVLANLQNCQVQEIPFKSGYNLPAGLKSNGAGLCIVCNPNAPSGSFIEPDELSNLADRLRGKSVLLIDEAYVDFAEKNCTELAVEKENVIILRSMSKGYSLAGLRFGYAIASEAIINGLMKVKDSYNVDAVAIKAASAAIRDREYFLENIEKVKTERTRMTEKLKEFGFEVPKSNANFVLAKIDTPPAKQIYEKLAEKNIYVRYFDLPGLTDKLRISIGTAEQNERFLNVLKYILR